MTKFPFVVLVVLFACSKTETEMPRVKPLMEAVYASGTVVADDEYQVFSQADGVLKEILQREGQSVQAGQGILVIESQQQDARYNLAEENFVIAKKNIGSNSPVLAEVQTQVRSAYARFRLDSVNFVRYQNLARENATKQVEYDRARLAYENSANDWKVAQQRVERTRNDLQMAYRQAESQWRIAQEESGNYTVKSGIEGMVFNITKQKGELVRRGELIAVVGKKDQFHLQLNVDELDVKRIAEGQKVLVKIEAYPDRIFSGKITRVYPLVDVRQQSLRVDASLDDTLPGWFSGLTVEANIVIQEKQQTLVIAKSLILPGDSVLVEDNEGLKKIRIARGIETLEEVEVLEGLTATSKLVSKQ